MKLGMLMKAKHQRLIFIAVSMLFVAAATVMVLTAFEDNLVFFYSPTELVNATEYDDFIRAGGVVKEGSVVHSNDSDDAISVSFVITDFENDLLVEYDGELPSLFREGQGVVVEGKIYNKNKNIMLKASRVLAKHDENYMPPEVAKTLKENGHWQGDF